MRWWHWLMIAGGVLLLRKPSREYTIRTLRDQVATKLDASVPGWTVTVKSDGYVNAVATDGSAQLGWPSVDAAINALRREATSRTTPASVGVNDLQSSLIIAPTLNL